MRALIRMMLPCLFCAQLSFDCLAQSGIITTYVGPSMPVNGAQATTQSLDNPTSVAPDGVGGFYVFSSDQNKIYHVSADGRLRLAAGSGTPGYSGDGGQAISAQLGRLCGVAADSAGNLYIADAENNRIRKVTPAGVITAIAGNGIRGYSGDGGQATSAQLSGPCAVAVDSEGNLYIADNGNSCIRKVTPDGVVTTVAGKGEKGFSGDGGQAASARLNNPNGAVVDSAGNLYIADTDNNRIRKITPDGVITTVAGNGKKGFSGDGGRAASAQLDRPHSIALSSVGNLYIADTNNHRVRLVTPAGVIFALVGNGEKGFSGDEGKAISAQLRSPFNIAVDSAANAYIADSGNHRIRKVTPAGVITTVAGNGAFGYSSYGGQAISAQVFMPGSVAMDSADNLYIADTGNSRIRKVTPAGVITTVAGNGEKGFSGDDGQAASAQLSDPNGVAVDSAGNLYIADTDNCRIRKVAPDGIITTVAGNGKEGFSGDSGQAASAQLYHPHGVAVDSAGNLYIADTNNHRIRKVTPDGVITTIAGNNAGGYSGDGGQAASARLAEPHDVTVDSAGNLYIADTDNNCIRKVTPDGAITTVAGNGKAGFSGDGGKASSAQLFWPCGIAMDFAGNLYIADNVNNRIRKVTPDGVITTIAGNGEKGFSGDGGRAALAQLDRPHRIAVDSAGKLYIADTNSNRIRKVLPLSQ
jgi:trimeric autotransporter adhesin